VITNRNITNGNKVVVYIISSLFLCCIVAISSYIAGEDFTGSQMVVNDELGSDPDSPDSATLETLSSLIKLKETVN
jgi:hypothetical protein